MNEKPEMNRKQAVAICYNEWEEKNSNKGVGTMNVESGGFPIEKSFNVFVPVTKSFIEKDIDGIERRYIEVTVSGLKEDRDGEKMSQQAINKMIQAFKENRIPAFNNHGYDKNGNRIYDWRDIVGKWVDAWQEGDRLVARMQINMSNPDGERLWKYAHHEGMPIGFSIGGRVLDKTEVDE
ncbi:MAG: hypothetical protein D6734_11030 [Candidatus Schekmanbacteria bacterium]|nr:MAG: hypothetical protein D6734_11030 [Candidatus Schekmanbacteria bacterium]